MHILDHRTWGSTMNRKIKIVCICSMVVLAACQVRQPLSVGIFLCETEGTEAKAVLNWLESTPFDVKILQTDIDISRLDVGWIHLPDETDWEMVQRDSQAGDLFRRMLERSIPLFLTGYAAMLPHEWGFESNPPEVFDSPFEERRLFDKKGLQSWRGHPAFNGLFGGAYLYDGEERERGALIGYFDDFPGEGRVAGVEKSYIHLHRTRRLMVEHEQKGLHLLSAGGLTRFSPSNRARPQLERFTENCLRYLGGDFRPCVPTYWEDRDFSIDSIAIDPVSFEPASRRAWEPSIDSGLFWEQEQPDGGFFDLAGRRILVMGREKGGVDEVWTHPFRAFRRYGAAVLQNGKPKALETFPSRLTIRPESLTRLYTLKGGVLREVVCVSVDQPGCLIHYEYTGEDEIDLLITVSSDLRWMWPYDEKSLGGIEYGVDKFRGAVLVRDRSGAFNALIGGDIAPKHILAGAVNSAHLEGETGEGDKDENEIAFGFHYSLGGSGSSRLNIGLAGTDQGEKAVRSHYMELLEHFPSVYEDSAEHYRRLLECSVTVESPDEEFDRLWQWALVGTDRFWVHTPGLGTALTAGYATTQRGWDGGHAVNGRPGYGWYFGRDAAWSAFAVNDYGDVESVRKQLEFFQKFQDLNGKIFHELSTSGVVHYDAADATPLYIMLAAHYLRASGDLPFIRESWSCLQKAMAFLYSTDTDGDGLIENTGVGHGWVEGGGLYGAHTTLYLAGLWARTLSDAADMAGALGYGDLEDRYRREGEKVRSVLNSEFWNEAEHFSFYGLYEDGTMNPEKTVLPAVLMAWNLLDDDKAASMLPVLAGNGFSSDWGVRILSAESPLFNPRGYHYGSVWPLFTGWTALAEYEYGHAVQGFAHIYNNLLIKNHWALGFVEEVMNGSVYEPSGVCPHQCWSETNILHPGITGLIGWKPDALENRAALKPRVPWHWDRFSVRNLRAGRHRLHWTMERKPGEIVCRFDHEGGRSSLILDFSPELLPGMEIVDIQLDGKSMPFRNDRHRGLLRDPVSFPVRKTRTLRVLYRGGITVLPKIARPVPGSRSGHARVVDHSWRENVYSAVLEGESDTTHDFTFRLPGGGSVTTGGRSLPADERGFLNLPVYFPESDKAYSTCVVQIRPRFVRH